jgi:DNA-binding GntR family transcriptional regulator
MQAMSSSTVSDDNDTRTTAQEPIVDQLRALILDHHFSPGQRLVQSELAKQLGVSRTPVREALHKLAAEGLVAFSAYKGATVTPFSISDLKGIYCVRVALEGYAAYLAAERITEDEVQHLEELLQQMVKALSQDAYLELLGMNRQFHMGIYAASKEERLTELISNYFDLAEGYRRIFVSLNHARDELVKHREVLHALQNGDGVTAEQLTRAHLQKTVATLVKFLGPK